MTFYTDATGAGWIVPKKYVEKVGDDGFKKAPIGAGPYRFVSFTPGRGAGARGVRAVLAQAAEREAARLQGDPRRVHPPGRAQARRGGHRLRGPRRAGRAAPAHAGADAQARRGAGHVLGLLHRAVGSRSRRGTTGACAWPPTSPSTGRRSTRPSCSGSPGSSWSIIPRSFEYYWQPPALRVRSRPGQAAPGRGRLPQRLRRRRLHLRRRRSPTSPSPSVNYLRAVGIQARLRPLERAAFFKGYADKKYTGPRPGRQRRLRQCGHADRGVRRRRAAPTPTGAIPTSTGCSGSRRAELDPKRREAILQRIQQLIHDKVIFAPIWLSAGLNGVGPRVEESGLGLIAGYAFSAPYEDLKLKGK